MIFQRMVLGDGPTITRRRSPCIVLEGSNTFASEGSPIFLPKFGSIFLRTVTPHSRGSVDYPSTHGKLVNVGQPNTTHENLAESPLYGELYPRTNLFQTIQYNP